MLKKLIAISVLMPTLLWANGDNIRGMAPLTALVLDARAGNSGPLREAYSNEIDFFLDMEPARQRAVMELINLRDAARAIEASDYATAEQKLRTIQGFASEKKYLRGALDAAQGRYQQSLESFRQLIDNRHDLDSRRLTNLAFMGAARVFHEIEDYTQAIYHYNQVRQLESEFFQAVFEKGWSFYLNGDMNGALGATLTFQSPYFESAFYPEAMVVRAAAFFQLCYFDRATATAQETKRSWEPIQRQIKELQNRDPKSWLFDQRILKGVHPRILGALVADSRFRSALRAKLGLEAELRSLGGRREAALTSQALAHVKTQLVSEGSRVLRTADKLVSDVLAQMDMIAIEILQAAANQLLGIPPEEQAKVKIIDLGDVDFDRMVQFWPFKGEFWVDELGSYYYGLKSKCETEALSQNKVKAIAFQAAMRRLTHQNIW